MLKKNTLETIKEESEYESITENRKKDYNRMFFEVFKKRNKIFNLKCFKDIFTDIKVVKNIKIIERIGSGSIGGEAYRACFPFPGDCLLKLAIKIIPLDNRIDLTYIKPYIKNKRVNFSDIFKDQVPLNFSSAVSEIFFMELVGKLVKQRVCPNLPLYYGGFVCNNCEYSNIKLNKNNRNCLIIPNELADGDLKKIIDKSAFFRQNNV